MFLLGRLRLGLFLLGRLFSGLGCLNFLGCLDILGVDNSLQILSDQRDASVRVGQQDVVGK